MSPSFDHPICDGLIFLFSLSSYLKLPLSFTLCSHLSFIVYVSKLFFPNL
ncbi:hypothetical protein BACI71_30475 [Bacillus mycoides]|uniref:Uncharacterized protein n=1 Tax=Bacillus mycoides TaxID=1405 RepID=A0A653XF96_BACMY|nr:hypothetical protein BACI71_30475 [Bacillus mycoides]